MILFLLLFYLIIINLSIRYIKPLYLKVNNLFHIFKEFFVIIKFFIIIIIINNPFIKLFILLKKIKIYIDIETRNNYKLLLNYASVIFFSLL